MHCIPLDNVWGVTARGSQCTKKRMCEVEDLPPIIPLPVNRALVSWPSVRSSPHWDARLTSCWNSCSALSVSAVLSTLTAVCVWCRLAWYTAPNPPSPSSLERSKLSVAAWGGEREGGTDARADGGTAGRGEGRGRGEVRGWLSEEMCCPKSRGGRGAGAKDYFFEQAPSD